MDELKNYCPRQGQATQLSYCYTCSDDYCIGKAYTNISKAMDEAQQAMRYNEWEAFKTRMEKVIEIAVAFHALTELDNMIESIPEVIKDLATAAENLDDEL